MDEPDPGENETFFEHTKLQAVEAQDDSTLTDLKSLPKKMKNVVGGSLFLNDKPNEQSECGELSKTFTDQDLSAFNEVNKEK